MSVLVSIFGSACTIDLYKLIINMNFATAAVDFLIIILIYFRYNVFNNGVNDQELLID